VRYRRPAGSIPPLTDAVGHLLQVDPTVQIRTKAGTVTEFAPADAIALRVLTDAPVRISAIRALEHAAALACPGVEHRWLNGWFLRAAHGVGREPNSAVPLDVSAGPGALPTIADWYARRGLIPWLAVPDRLLRLPGPAAHPYRMLVRDVRAAEPDPAVNLASHPDGPWLRGYRGELPVEVLTAVIDGEAVFGAHPGMAVGRAAVTDAPDGTRWVGLSALRLSDDPGTPAAARQLCDALLAWGAQRGASRGYVRVLDCEVTVGRLVESLGFTIHHRGRYLVAAKARASAAAATSALLLQVGWPSKPTWMSSSPTRDAIATPFHWLNPQCATS
jgi:N-acetylglutamate synthase